MSPQLGVCWHDHSINVVIVDALFLLCAVRRGRVRVNQCWMLCITTSTDNASLPALRSHINGYVRKVCTFNVCTRAKSLSQETVSVIVAAYVCHGLVIYHNLSVPVILAALACTLVIRHVHYTFSMGVMQHICTHVILPYVSCAVFWRRVSCGEV